MREIKFKALAPILKGKNKGKLAWWENVYINGQTVLIETPHLGIKELKEVKAICQSTSLRDKNGKEIYEGDKILIENYDKDKLIGVRIFIVEWSLYGWVVRNVFDYKDVYPLNMFVDLDNPEKVLEEFEIVRIGNIYETSGL